MLNEILEFKAYVEDPESDRPRIQPKMLTENYESDDLNGIGGILVILARGFIFGFETEQKVYNEEGLVHENILNDTKYILLHSLCVQALMSSHAQADIFHYSPERSAEMDRLKFSLQDSEHPPALIGE